MAQAANKLITVTWWQVGLGVIGLIALGFTLKYTRDTARAGIAAASEASWANKVADTAMLITRDSAERELRAYVFIEKANRIKPPNAPFAAPWEIVTRIKNFGQTPAYEVNAWIKWAVLPNSEETNLSKPTGNPDIVKVSIPPRGFLDHRIIAGDLSTEPNWNNFRKRASVVFLWGRIEYLDAFKEKQETEFRLIHEFGPVQSFAYCSAGNRAT